MGSLFVYSVSEGSVYAGYVCAVWQRRIQSIQDTALLLVMLPTTLHWDRFGVSVPRVDNFVATVLPVRPVQLLHEANGHVHKVKEDLK